MSIIKQKKVFTGDSNKQVIPKYNFNLYITLKRNKFFSQKSNNISNQQQCPQQNQPLTASKKYKSVTLNKQLPLKQNTKSSYQQYRQNRKKNLHDKWNGLLSQRRGKLSISSINPNENIQNNRSLVIHSRNNQRGNYGLQSKVQLQQIQLNYRTTPIPQKFLYLYELIHKSRLNEHLELIALSKQKNINQKKVQRKIKSKQLERISKNCKRTQSYYKINQEKSYRPWSGARKDFQLQDLATIKYGF